MCGLNGGELIFEGKIGSLNDSKMTQLKRQGQECGIRPDNFTNFEVGDVIEAYLVEKIRRIYNALLRLKSDVFYFEKILQQKIPLYMKLSNRRNQCALNLDASVFQRLSS